MVTWVSLGNKFTERRDNLATLGFGQLSVRPGGLNHLDYLYQIRQQVLVPDHHPVNLPHGSPPDSTLSV
jgi:hypothetical protein